MLGRILFITERSVWGHLAHSFLQNHVSDLHVVFWQRGDVRPRVIEEWSGEWILSFKSDLVLAERILRSATTGALNFHPAPPRYRGIGGHHWALRHGDTHFGATCHHMVERIDFGPIVEVRRFELLPTDTASSLQERSSALCLVMFYDIVSLISRQQKLPCSAEAWHPHLYTFAELDQLLSQ